MIQQKNVPKKVLICLNQDDYDEEQLLTIDYQKIKNIEVLTYGFNEKLKLFRQFSGLSFLSLFVLSLVNNTIQSIECICAMNIPSLKLLELKHNKITNIKTLRKINCPLLEQISIYANPLKVGMVSLTELYTPRLKNLKIEYLNNLVIEENCLWVAKIDINQEGQNKKFSLVYMKGGHRIKQQKGIKIIIDKKIM